jgi:hypothetical protein
MEATRPAVETPPQLARTGKVMNEWPRIACGQIQSRQSDGQVETAWPSTSRIEIEHAADSLNQRPMRVARNNHVDPARHRIELQFVDVVEDIDGMPAEPYHLGVRIVFRPLALIDVPSDRNNRRNPAESVQDVRTTDVAGMDYMRHSGEPLPGLWTQESVGIRDNSDFEHYHMILVARQYGRIANYRPLPLLS